ncbi:hypothetical protein KR200_011234 [Drosophila serrata]|nr:hypothetical protein KR200_011234 [Drosophila serrata]
MGRKKKLPTGVSSGGNNNTAAPKTVGGFCVPLGLPQPLLLEEKKFLLAVERGDMPNVRSIGMTERLRTYIRCPLVLSWLSALLLFSSLFLFLWGGMHGGVATSSHLVDNGVVLVLSLDLDSILIGMQRLVQMLVQRLGLMRGLPSVAWTGDAM